MEKIPISAQDGVLINQVIEGILADEIEITDLPESYRLHGKTFPITMETLKDGLVRQLGERDRKLKHELAIATVDGGLFNGISTSKQPDKTNRDRVYLNLLDSDTPLKTRKIEIFPAVLEGEPAEQLVRSAIPSTIEDYEHYIKDILKSFTKRGLILTQVGHYAGMGNTDVYERVIEERSSRANELVQRVALRQRHYRTQLGDDYSVNQASLLNAQEFYDEMQASENPDAYAINFAATWLELRFAQEIALRSREELSSYGEPLDREYAPGTIATVSKSLTEYSPGLRRY